MENYTCISLLGQGSYGTVYKARHNETGQIFAIKENIIRSHIQGVPATTIREISLLRELRSPYIVRLHDVTLAPGENGDQKVYIVFEYVEYDLLKYMREMHAHGMTMHRTMVKHLIFQLLLGLQHCHENGVMHRDLKPENLLLDPSKRLLKLADFGLSRLFSLPVERYTHEVVTLWYRAPEILLGSKEYSTAVDIWSVGCILAQMLHGRPIIKGDGELEQLLAIFRNRGTPTEDTWPSVTSLRDWHVYPQWNEIPLAIAVDWRDRPDHDCLDLLSNLLTMDPAKRITALQATRSSYFDDIRSEYS